MAWTSEQLIALETAIAQGIRTVRYGDKEVTYQTLDQMRALRREMRTELGLDPVMKKYFHKHSKGLE